MQKFIHQAVAQLNNDLLFFDLEEVDPMVLSRALNEGILLKNEDPDLLSDRIDALSGFFLENEAMIRRAKELRRERLERLSGTR